MGLKFFREAVFKPLKISVLQIVILQIFQLVDYQRVTYVIHKVLIFSELKYSC